MHCPKCGGQAFLAEEEFIQALKTEPVKIIARAVYSCNACSERFTRLQYETLDERTLPAQTSDTVPEPPQPASNDVQSLKLLDEALPVQPIPEHPVREVPEPILPPAPQPPQKRLQDEELEFF